MRGGADRADGPRPEGGVECAGPGAKKSGAPHRLIDLGSDEFTRGHPHPMTSRAAQRALQRALEDKAVGVVLLDVVIGYGAHADPAD